MRRVDPTLDMDADEGDDYGKPTINSFCIKVYWNDNFKLTV